MLLSLRTRTVRGIRCDFPGIYKDRKCPLGCGEEDTIPNILKCSVLKKNFKSDSVSNGKIQHEDIFSDNVKKQKEVTEMYANTLYGKLLETRNKIINNSLPVACTGPLQSTPTLQNHSVL